jgi:hypothetical protein
LITLCAQVQVAVAVQPQVVMSAAEAVVQVDCANQQPWL